MGYPDRPSYPREFEGGLERELGGSGGIRVTKSDPIAALYLLLKWHYRLAHLETKILDFRNKRRLQLCDASDDPLQGKGNWKDVGIVKLRQFECQKPIRNRRMVPITRFANAHMTSSSLLLSSKKLPRRNMLTRQPFYAHAMYEM